MPKRKSGWKPKEERTHLKCKDCNKELPRESFVTEGKAPSGLQRYSARCKPCYNIHSKKNWRSARDIAPCVQRNKEYIAKIKQKCEKCGYSKCKAALDFHHTDSNEKKYEISKLIYSKTDLEILKEEVKKCIVLCANCHRETHAEECAGVRIIARANGSRTLIRNSSDE